MRDTNGVWIMAATNHQNVPKLSHVGIALALMLGGATAAPAQTNFWNPAVTGGGSWGTASNWVGNIIPAGSVNTAGFALDFTSGALVTLDGNRTIGTVTSSSANPWTLDPGTGGTLTVATITVTGGGPLTVTAPLSGTDFTKNGTGTLVLASPSSTYTGAININAGTLQLIGSGNYATGNVNVHVASGATIDVTGLISGLRFGGLSTRAAVNNGDVLTGTGTVSGGLHVFNGGTVYPGDNGVGTLTVKGGTTFDSGSNWRVQLASAIPGNANTNNVIDISGNLTVSTGTNMRIDGSGLTYASGSTYDYLIATPTSNNINLGGASFFPTNFGPTGIATPSSFTLIPTDQGLILRFAPVPEPAFALAAAMGAAAAYGALRRVRYGQLSAAHFGANRMAGALPPETVRGHSRESVSVWSSPSVEGT
jgi:autotransporter-associated beta strand protein